MTAGPARQPDHPGAAGVCGGRRRVAALITHVVVDPARPGLRPPDQADRPVLRRRSRPRQLAAERGWDVVEDAGRGYRRVVAVAGAAGLRRDRAPSRCLLDAGHVVVAGGGGGIPVRPDGDGLRTGSRRSSTRTTPPAALAAALGARGPRARHRRRRGDAGLRHRRPSAGSPRIDVGRGRAAPGGRPVPRGQHGAEGARRDPLPARRRRMRRHHHARLAAATLALHATGDDGRGGTRDRAAPAAAQAVRHDVSTSCGSSATPTSTPWCSSSATRAMRESTGSSWAARGDGHPGQRGDPARRRGSPGRDRRRQRPTTCSSPCAGRPTRDAVPAALAAGRDGRVRRAGQPRPRDRPSARPAPWREAVRRTARANVAIVSVPGDYAALEAHEALRSAWTCCCSATTCPWPTRSRSRSEPLALGRLVMGPGAGTALLGGTGLGFANVVTARAGSGIIAAAGTGAQEAMALLDRWGVGVSQVIGLGGRDLSAAVDGRMATPAIAALRDDPGTDVDPPRLQAAGARVARRGPGGGRHHARRRRARRPGRRATPAPPGVPWSRTLESGVVAELRLLGVPVPTGPGPARPGGSDVRRRLAPERTAVRGLFSGGTPLLRGAGHPGRTLGEVYSNTPARPDGCGCRPRPVAPAASTSARRSTPAAARIR